MSASLSTSAAEPWRREGWGVSDRQERDTHAEGCLAPGAWRQVPGANPPSGGTRLAHGVDRLALRARARVAVGAPLRQQQRKVAPAARQCGHIGHGLSPPRLLHNLAQPARDARHARLERLQQRQRAIHRHVQLKGQRVVRLAVQQAVRDGLRLAALLWKNCLWGLAAPPGGENGEWVYTVSDEASQRFVASKVHHHAQLELRHKVPRQRRASAMQHARTCLKSPTSSRRPTGGLNAARAARRAMGASCCARSKGNSTG